MLRFAIKHAQWVFIQHWLIYKVLVRYAIEIIKRLFRLFAGKSFRYGPLAVDVLAKRRIY